MLVVVQVQLSLQLLRPTCESLLLSFFLFSSLIILLSGLSLFSRFFDFAGTKFFFNSLEFFLRGFFGWVCLGISLSCGFGGVN